MKPASLLIVFAATLLGAGAGCRTTIIPPPASPDSVPVFVTDYGRHSSILLPDPAGHYNEYAFGDFDWFALSRTSAGSAVRAMFFSRDSTMGRRQLDLPGELDAVAGATGAATVIRFNAPREPVERLIDALDARFERRIDSITYNPRSSMWFVRDDESYWMFHNCNHVTARWLRKLGCDIRGPAILSKFVVKPRAE